MISVGSLMMYLRSPLWAKEGGPAPGTGSSDEPSPGVSEPTHLVQFYNDDAYLVDVVGTFLAEALVKGDGVLVLATEEHRTRFEEVLHAAGIDVGGAVHRGRYVALDAAETLDELLTDDRPDAASFERVVGTRVARLEERFSRVRA